MLYGWKLPALSSLSSRIALGLLLLGQLTLLVTEEEHRWVAHVLVEVIQLALESLSHESVFILNIPHFESRQHGGAGETFAIGRQLDVRDDCFGEGEDLLERAGLQIVDVDIGVSCERKVLL